MTYQLHQVEHVTRASAALEKLRDELTQLSVELQESVSYRNHSADRRLELSHIGVSVENLRTRLYDERLDADLVSLARQLLQVMPK